MKVEIEIPDEILEFLKAMNANVKEYLEETISNGFESDLDAFLGLGDIFVFSDEPPILAPLEKLKSMPNLKETIDRCLK